MITKWWQTLAQRERIMITAGVILGVILLFYTFILNPLNSAIDNLRDEIQTQQTLIRWMQQADAHILQLRQAGFTANSVSTQHEAVLVLVEHKLSDMKLNRYLQHTQQPQSNTLVLHFHQVPFDDLMHWIQDLSHQYQIGVQQFSATKTDPMGTVDANLTLQQSKY
jgi:general secretion pathway protein M